MPRVVGGGGLEAKVVILGAQGVGKTSIVYRYTSGEFNASAVPSTIGASFLTKKLVVDDVKVSGSEMPSFATSPDLTLDNNSFPWHACSADFRFGTLPAKSDSAAW